MTKATRSKESSCSATQQTVRSSKERREQQSAAAIAQRLEGRERSEQHQADRLVEDRNAVHKELAVVEQQGGSRQQQRAVERRRNKVEQRELRLLERNDEAVRQALQRKDKLSGILAADQPTDADEMLWFISQELKLVSVLQELAPPPTRIDEQSGKEIQCRQTYPPLVLNLIGILSRYLGLSSNPEIEAVVLTDLRWMSLLGFNATEVQQGTSRRSESLRGKTRTGQGGTFEEADELGPVRTRLEGPRGALSAQTVEGHESQLQPKAVVTVFNAVVRALARRGYFPKQVRTSLDSTGAEVVPSFSEAGVVRKKVKVQSKARRPRQVEVSVRGFKIWYLMEVESGLPLAMTMDTIETAETTPARQLIEQARSNLKGYSRIVSVSLDRGFLDGDLLWWLKKDKRIDWVCPSKQKMHVTTEARGRVAAALAALSRKGESELETAQRAARRQLNHEGVAFCERTVAEGRAPLVIAQVQGLHETSFYGPGGSSSSRVHSKKYRVTPLHATVVLSWPDRHAADVQDAQQHDAEDNGPVVLLSPIEEAGFVRFDRYDERSLIENRLNRDGKQYFGLGKPLARNTKAMWSSTLFSTIALMLHRGLALHREQVAEAQEKRGEQLGVLRYRRQQLIKNRGRVIVVVGDHYGVLRLEEFAALLGAQFI
jgi:hypothetical protein